MKEEGDNNKDGQTICKGLSKVEVFVTNMRETV